METTTYFCSKHKRMKKIIFGIILIASGVLLLCFNSGLLDPAYRHVVFSWPMLLVAIGIMNIFSKESIFSGIVLLLIGGFFLLPRLFFLPDNFAHNFWPGLLIIIGILIIARRTIFHNHFHHHHFQSTSEMKNDSGFIVLNNIFGGGKHKVPPTEFKGGKISNIFGGTELDLTQATLAPGTNVLEIDCIFGGASIIVPADWAVTVQVTSIMGGFSDKRSNIRNTNATSDRELIIKGSAIFGGGDVKSY
jgi:predicted membrane protein